MKKSQTIIVSIAIGILMIIAFSFWGFSGIGKTKTVKNMTNSEKSLIANSFNIVLDNDENISKFTRNESNGDYYYSIFINNITDMEQFKKTNNNIQYFVEKKNILTPYDYIPKGFYMCCYYNDDIVVLSVYTYSKDFNSEISNLFNQLYLKS